MSSYLDKVLRVIESSIGGLLGMVIAFELIVAGVLLVIDPPSGNIHVPRVWSIPILAVTVLFDGWLVMALWDGFHAPRLHLGFAVAQRMPRLHPAWRPIVAVIWFAHAIALGVTACAMHRVMARSASGGGVPVPPFVLLVFAMTFLCNIYILLFLSAVSPGWRAPGIFWRWRFAVDVALSAGSIFLN